MRREAGFTIIELLVVIAIIGILLTLTFLSIKGIPAASRDSARAEDLAAISRKLEKDYNDQVVGGPSYPPINVFVSDAASGTGTAANVDPNIFIDPTATTSSLENGPGKSVLVGATPGSVVVGTYYYAAFTDTGAMCTNANQVCVSYQLYYITESGNKIVTFDSLHQQ